MAIDLETVYFFFTDFKREQACIVWIILDQECTKRSYITSLSYPFGFFFMNEKDPLGASSKIGHNDIGYFAINFPTIWWITLNKP